MAPTFKIGIFCEKFIGPYLIVLSLSCPNCEAVYVPVPLYKNIKFVIRMRLQICKISLDYCVFTLEY